MKTRILSSLPRMILCVAALGIQAQTILADNISNGKLFIIKNTGDTVDANPGDDICADSSGNCTLRAAIEESKANKGFPDTIIFELPYPAMIELTQGSLDLGDGFVMIIGPGARKLTIRRNAASIPFSLFKITNVTNGFNGPMIRGMRLEGGHAASGGAIHIGAGVVVDMFDMWITGNSAGTGGAVSNYGKLSVTRSLISGNSADTEGGALYLATGSTTRFTNSTITTNSAATGGAIYAAGAFLSVNNTITHNSATSQASGIASVSGSSVTVFNTIIGADSSFPVTSIIGSFNSLGNNIVTDARGAKGFTNGVNGDQVSDNNAIDPLLGALTDNGGNTDTRSLLSNSPAIDAGNSCVNDATCTGLPANPAPLIWDQRVRYARRSPINGIVDIGAFEQGITVTFGRFNAGPFNIGVGPRRSAMATLINVRTGERRYSITDLLGRFGFTNLDSAELYVMDVRSKSFQTAPVIFPWEYQAFSEN